MDRSTVGVHSEASFVIGMRRVGKERTEKIAQLEFALEDLKGADASALPQRPLLDNTYA
jgi:hypothetical protein